MTIFKRKRVVTAAVVAAFLAVLLGVGAVSRSTSNTAAPTALQGATTTPTVPSELWYWTMAVAPSDPNVLVLGTNSGLLRSTDGGKTWKATGPKNVNATSLVSAGSVIFMGGARASASAGPVVRKGNARAATDGASVFAASTDGGRSWRLLHPAGLPNVAVQALAVDPASSNTLYALLNSGTLYRSTDDASTFRLVSSRIGIPPWALAITQNSHFVGGDMDAGPHTSSNGHAWETTAYTDARGGHMVMEYAVQPSDSTRILMTSIGVEISSDGGKSWQPGLKSSVMFGPVAWSASEPDLAYAVGFDSSIWRTDDAGKSWTIVS